MQPLSASLSLEKRGTGWLGIPRSRRPPGACVGSGGVSRLPSCGCQGEFLASFPSGFCVHSEMQTVYRDDSKLCPSPGNDKRHVTLTQVLVSC